MKNSVRVKSESGFSLMELMISIAILIPVMGAAIGLFSVGARQHASEQSSIDASQEARAAFELMTTEIAQACSHPDKSTMLTAGVGTSTNPVSVAVASTAGFGVGDYVEVDTGINQETVVLTAVGTETLRAVFRIGHNAGAPVRLFALPYTDGVIRPAGMAANSSVTGPTLRFFGDINGDSTLQFVEYAYNAANNEITRSITPITQANRNPAVIFVRNVKPGSVQFTINTDKLGVVTSVNVSMAVANTVRSGSKYQEMALSSRTTVPSAITGSALLYENRRYGGFNRLPPTPSKITEWTSQ
jgi:hypothetical protein